MILRLLAIFMMLSAPIFGASNVNPQSACDVSSYGKTGKQLPTVFREAIRVTKAEMGFVESDIVYVTDFEKFVHCRGFTDATQIEWIRKETRGGAFGGQLPIYFYGIRQDVSEAVAGYDAEHEYVKYIVASWIGHEWDHLILHETLEVQPFTKELELLQAYKTALIKKAPSKEYADFLGLAFRPFIEKAQANLELAWINFRAKKGPVYITVAGNK